jgi:teichuronic acid biosynthesis glycosyltransferase TuaC
MKILIVCSGNAPDHQVFDVKLHHAFIYEQVSELEKSGISFDFFYIRGKGASGYIKSILRLRKKIKSKDFDIIHSHYGLSGLVATFQRKLPLVATFHGCDVNRKSLNILSSFVGIFSRANIFVSEDLKNRIFVKTPHKNFVIPCGIDLKQFRLLDKQEARTKLNLDDSKKYILFSSAKNIPVKNWSLARRAADQYPYIELLELSEKTREEVNLLMNASDLFLMTSLREGSPQTIKEAMACNCPVVSTDVGDVRWVIGSTAGCYISGYDPSDVAEKIQKALEFVQTKGRTNGRERIIELGLDSETIAGKVIEVYKKVLKIND